MVPLICEEMHFRLIGRKKFFTAGRVGPLLPPGKLALLRERTIKKETNRGLIQRQKDNIDSCRAT